MKLYYYPLAKLTHFTWLALASHCHSSSVAMDIATIRGEPCFVFITSTPTEERAMRECKIAEPFYVLNIDNVLELLDFKKGE